MDALEEMKRWIAWVIQNVGESDSKQIKADIDLFMGVALQLTTELANRNTALAKQCRPRNVKPPKASSAKGPQQEDGKQSSTDTPGAQNDAEKRPEEQSRIWQGIEQSDPSLADQQRALRRQIYGAQNNDVAFNKAARAIAS